MSPLVLPRQWMIEFTTEMFQIESNAMFWEACHEHWCCEPSSPPLHADDHLHAELEMWEFTFWLACQCQGSQTIQHMMLMLQNTTHLTWRAVSSDWQYWLIDFLMISALYRAFYCILDSLFFILPFLLSVQCVFSEWEWLLSENCIQTSLHCTARLECLESNEKMWGKVSVQFSLLGTCWWWDSRLRDAILLVCCCCCDAALGCWAERDVEMLRRVKWSEGNEKEMNRIECISLAERWIRLTLYRVLHD